MHLKPESLGDVASHHIFPMHPVCNLTPVTFLSEVTLVYSTPTTLTPHCAWYIYVHFKRWYSVLPSSFYYSISSALNSVGIY